MSTLLCSVEASNELFPFVAECFNIQLNFNKLAVKYPLLVPPKKLLSIISC